MTKATKATGATVYEQQKIDNETISDLVRQCIGAYTSAAIAVHEMRNEARLSGIAKSLDDDARESDVFQQWKSWAQWNAYDAQDCVDEDLHALGVSLAVAALETLTRYNGAERFERAEDIADWYIDRSNLLRYVFDAYVSPIRTDADMNATEAVKTAFVREWLKLTDGAINPDLSK